jgi:hypothetical protein
MHCVVQKPFSGNGIDYLSNWLVDTGDWPIRRRDQMITQRFIRIASEEEVNSVSEEEVPPRRSTSRPRKKKTAARKRR